MAYRAFRPQSANFRAYVKPRTTATAAELDKALNYDPWKSMYRDNFKGTRPGSVAENRSALSQLDGLSNKPRKPNGHSARH